MSAGGCGWIAVVEIARAGAVCCMIRGRGAELIALWKRACACGGIADSGGNRLFRDVSAEGRKQVSGAGIAERRMPPISTTSSSLRTARLHSSNAVCAPERGGLSPPRRFWGGRLRNRLRMRRRPTDTCRECDGGCFSCERMIRAIVDTNALGCLFRPFRPASAGRSFAELRSAVRRELPVRTA